MKKEFYITQDDAQKIWDDLTANIILAKYGDEGFALPAVDMAEIFKGRKAIKWQEVNDSLQRLIENWNPLN